MDEIQKWLYKEKPVLCTDGVCLPSIILEEALDFSESKTVTATFNGKTMLLVANGVIDKLALKYCRRFGV